MNQVEIKELLNLTLRKATMLCIFFSLMNCVVATIGMFLGVATGAAMIHALLAILTAAFISVILKPIKKIER